MILSAWMLKFLEHLKVNKCTSLIVANELMDRRRNNWQYVDKSIDEMEGNNKVCKGRKENSGNCK